VNRAPLAHRLLPAFAALAALACGCGQGESSCGPGEAEVQSVIDGDTIQLAGGLRVRYLNVDAPESTGGHDDCYGAEASAFNRTLVSGRRVELTYDSPCTDRYGRLLAWVKVAGVEVNRKLVDEGYACAFFIPPSGEARSREFEDAELLARNRRAGMWGQCAAITCT
jgi:micrococcal nuclease